MKTRKIKITVEAEVSEAIPLKQIRSTIRWAMAGTGLNNRIVTVENVKEEKDENA
jgi:hypothetical protein